MTTMIRDDQRRRGDAGHRVWRRCWPGVLLAAVLAGAAVAGPAQADDFIVTNLNGRGLGSLRQAIEDANRNGAADTITFDGDLAGGTILLSRQLRIADDTADPDLSIDGDLDDDGAPDITVDGQGRSRVVFEIRGTPRATLQGLVITDGRAGGIRNDGTLTVTSSTISGNNGRDGGIRNDGTLTVTSSTISGNNGSSAGGIENRGTLTITNSTISGNNSRRAGGIRNFGTLTITNSTISGNSTEVGRSGGIATFGTLTITNSTISGNSTEVGRSGGIATFGGTLEIKSTIVAGNTPEDCGETSTSLGFNLEGGMSCGFTVTGDQQNVAVADVLVTDANGDPLLADNGGPTETIALLDGSPAIDHIPTAECTVEPDQRGVERPQPFPDGNCDIGAFELMQEASFTIADVIELLDQAVEDGTLMNAGPGNRLRALRNMLLTAGALLEQGNVDGGCTQLRRAADRTDGAFPPSDFAQGEAAPDLLEAITEVQDELGCFA